MLNCVNLGDNSERRLQLTDLESLELKGIWLEVEDPTEEELKTLTEKMGAPMSLIRLPETSAEIALRLERDIAFVSFLFVDEIVEAKETHPIVLAFSKDFLVTVQTKADQRVMRLVKARMYKNRLDPPSLVAYYILDEAVSHNFSHLEKIEEATENLEEEALEKMEKDTIKRIFRLKSHLVSFNKILWYERGLVFNLKKCTSTCLSSKARSLLDSTHEYLTRQIDIVETYREIMTDAINAHLSAVSNKINSAIKGLTVVIFYLTIITTITSFPNTIATFFGISQFGNTDYRIIFAALVLSMVFPLLWWWRRRWIRFDEKTTE